MEDKLYSVLSTYKKEKNQLIPILQHLQGIYTYLPEDIMIKVANYLNIPENQLYAVATFFAMFKFKPSGRNLVMVCRGTACHVKGAARILDEVANVLEIKEGETRQDLEYTLESVACIGCCALAPCIMINNKDVHGRLTSKKVRDIFISTNREGQDVS